jgi:hypothetical protein
LLNPWLATPGTDDTAPSTSRATNKSSNITSSAWEERFTSLEKLVIQQNTQLADIHKSLHLPPSTNNTQKPPTHDNTFSQNFLTALSNTTRNDNDDAASDADSTNELILELARRSHIPAPTTQFINDTDIKITSEELVEISNSSKQPREFDFENQLAGIAVHNITDTLARIIEKRRLTFIKNWTTIWPHLQLITNKPEISDKTWKRLAFGQYVELTDFTAQNVNQHTADEESFLKITDIGTITTTKGRKQRITNLPAWLQAWTRYTTAALIICAARQEELTHHQQTVIEHTATFSFDVTYLWERTKRFLITENRSRTLLTPNHDLDAKYLTLHRTSGFNQTTPKNGFTIRQDRKAPCRLYNWKSLCEYGNTCSYKHECEICGREHPARICNNRGKALVRGQNERNQPQPPTKKQKLNQ